MMLFSYFKYSFFSIIFRCLPFIIHYTSFFIHKKSVPLQSETNQTGGLSLASVPCTGMPYARGKSGQHRAFHFRK